MDTFAFIVHPISLEQIKSFWPLTKLLPNSLILSQLPKLPPFKLSRIKNVRSAAGKEVEGYFIVCPLLPEQMVKLDEKIVLDKIISAGHIAEELGAKIVGLGGYTSVVGDKGLTIARRLKIPVTSGNTYTAWAVFEAIYRAARAKKKDLGNSTLAVIGATGSIGSLCCRKLASCVSKIIITARHRDKLEALKEEILLLDSIEVVIEDDPRKAAKEADIVITTTSTPEVLLDVRELKSGAIACDVSIPKNIKKNPHSRQDLTIIDGGLIKLPFSANFGTPTGLPKNLIYACVAETMLLSLEGRFTGFSLGRHINLDKMELIADIAVRHGFEVWVPEAPIL